jgi:hypothetical protein
MEAGLTEDDAHVVIDHDEVAAAGSVVLHNLALAVAVGEMSKERREGYKLLLRNTSLDRDTQKILNRIGIYSLGGFLFWTREKLATEESINETVIEKIERVLLEHNLALPPYAESPHSHLVLIYGKPHDVPAFYLAASWHAKLLDTSEAIMRDIVEDTRLLLGDMEFRMEPLVMKYPDKEVDPIFVELRRYNLP